MTLGMNTGLTQMALMRIQIGGLPGQPQTVTGQWAITSDLLLTDIQGTIIEDAITDEVLVLEGTATLNGSPAVFSLSDIGEAIITVNHADGSTDVYQMMPHDRAALIETTYSVAAGEINPGEPAYDVVKTKTYSDDGSVLLSVNKVETYVTGQVVTSDTVYNSDGSSTFHKTEVRADDTLSKDVARDSSGYKVITKYELDGVTLKITIEVTPSTIEDVAETRIYKDASGTVYNTTTTTIDDESGQAIYTEIVDSTGFVLVHEANINVNFWGVTHDTHNHEWYGTGDNKVFITEGVDVNSNISVTTYSNKYGYSENGDGIVSTDTHTVTVNGVEWSEISTYYFDGSKIRHVTNSNDTDLYIYDAPETLGMPSFEAITGSYYVPGFGMIVNIDAVMSWDSSYNYVTETNSAETLIGGNPIEFVSSQFEVLFNNTSVFLDGNFIVTYPNGSLESYSLNGYRLIIYLPEDPSGLIIIGTTGDDILQGTTGVDNITTLEGSDVVYALAGNDTITLTADSVWGAGYVAKNMSIAPSVGTKEMIALNGFNRFTDVIDGGADVDTINLTDGNDAFFIDDVYSAHHSSLTLTSTTQGIDSIARITNLEVINAGEGNDIVDLTSNNFVLAEAVVINGEAGNDTLWGSNGNDIIDGGEGDDTIFGGTGGDTLTGGAGADAFQFTATAGSDIITDFGVGGDTIQLYYRAEDNHTNADLSLASGVLTWDVDSTSNDVVIDLSASINSSDLNDLDALISFVEIV